ncbi:hypothetical protein [Streptomyces phaeoluteigriseus]|uniref:hypothetical protein n=1 Tax=Streptomyces phaeoluteigriseus TaxID=114686 RepID=UPI00367F7462
MSLTFHRNTDGTTTGRNEGSGLTVTHVDAEEVKRRLYEDAGWEYTPPPPPVPPGFHRFRLMHEEFEAAGFADERYADLRARPPEGACRPTVAASRWSASVLGERSWTRSRGLSRRSVASTGW